MSLDLELRLGLDASDASAPVPPGVVSFTYKIGSGSTTSITPPDTVAMGTVESATLTITLTNTGNPSTIDSLVIGGDSGLTLSSGPTLPQVRNDGEKATFIFATPAGEAAYSDTLTFVINGQSYLLTITYTIHIPLELPAGYTAWMDLTGEADGAFPTLANKGSVTADWVRNGSAVTVASDGANSQSYAKAAVTTDYCKLNGKTLADVISAAKGTIACLFRVTLADDSASPWANQGVLGSSSSLLGIGTRASTNKIMPYHRGGSENATLALDYTSNTWRAVVFRWERGSVNKIYARLNGDASWAEASITQDLFALTGEVRAAGGVTGQTTTSGVQHAVFYADQSEASGDEIMAFLCEQGGLTDL